MYACPCCGYKTLPGSGEYDLCPVCWWEDEGGLEPWEHSGPNHQTLIDAQREFLADTRPYPRRPGKVRAPKQREARDPDWSPIEQTEELMARARQATEDERRHWEEEDRRYDQEVADDPEWPFREYNAGVQRLTAKAPAMTHRQIRQELDQLNRGHGPSLPAAFIDLQSRLITDENFYRHHPFHAAWWMLRTAQIGTVRQRWRMLRTGNITIAG